MKVERSADRIADGLDAGCESKIRVQDNSKLFFASITGRRDLLSVRNGKTVGKAGLSEGESVAQF